MKYITSILVIAVAVGAAAYLASAYGPLAQKPLLLAAVPAALLLAWGGLIFLRKKSYEENPRRFRLEFAAALAITALATGLAAALIF